MSAKRASHYRSSVQITRQTWQTERGGSKQCSVQGELEETTIIINCNSVFIGLCENITMALCFPKRTPCIYYLASFQIFWPFHVCLTDLSRSLHPANSHHKIFPDKNYLKSYLSCKMESLGVVQYVVCVKNSCNLLIFSSF